MRRRRWVILALLGGLLLVLGVVCLRTGPTYQGKSLGAWLKGFDAETPEVRWHAAEAVRQMGPNVVPRLIAQLAHARAGPEARWKQWTREMLSRQSVVKVAPFRRTDERGEVLAALDALGPEAKAAIPALGGLLHAKPPDHRALIVLARIGPEAVPVLSGALTNDERVIRMGARVCLDAMGSRSELVFPSTPENAEFMRRSCQFNTMMVGEAFKEYKTQHPEAVSPDSFDPRPPPRLPPGFGPPKASTTNSRPTSVLPPSAPGLE